MNGREKYFKLFDRLESLAGRVPWTEGVSNMLEWLTWDTSHVLGITKTQFWKQIIAWSQEAPVRDSTLEEKLDYVSWKLEQEFKRSEQFERYARRVSTIASPVEALRRAKFFSED